MSAFKRVRGGFEKEGPSRSEGLKILREQEILKPNPKLQKIQKEEAHIRQVRKHGGCRT